MKILVDKMPNTPRDCLFYRPSYCVDNCVTLHSCSLKSNRGYGNSSCDDVSKCPCLTTPTTTEESNQENNNG